MVELIPQAVAVPIDGAEPVSGLLLAPKAATSCFVFAHGAGAGMTHAFMSTFANGLAERGIATLRYQFPSMERGSRRPDKPAAAHAAVRAAVRAASQLLPEMPLVAGGKSFGARMSSQTQAEDPLPGVVGLAFIGFPLHPAGKPAVSRADHLSQVKVPLLFLQGTRDELAQQGLLEPLIQGLGPLTSVAWYEDADHSFHVRARSGQTDTQVMSAMLDRWVQWAAPLAAGAAVKGSLAR